MGKCYSSKYLKNIMLMILNYISDKKSLTVVFIYKFLRNLILIKIGIIIFKQKEK